MKITYKQFKKFQALVDLGGDNDEAMSIRMLEIFTNKSKEEVRKLSMEEMDYYFRTINDKLAETPSLKTRFIYKGKDYGLIPNFTKITTGELIDLDTLLADQNFEAIVSILYRPIISENEQGYLIEEYKGNLNQFPDIDYETVVGALDFFTRSFQNLKNHTLTSTNKEMMEMSNKEQK